MLSSLVSASAVKQLFIGYGAVLLAIALVRVFTTDSADPYHCSSLLNTGRFLDVEKGADGPVPKNWQPNNCLFHSYNSKEAVTCLRNKQVLFAGDSNVRQLFWEYVRTIDPDVEESHQKHANIHFYKDGVEIEFLWDPYLNSTSKSRLAECRSEHLSKSNSHIVLGSGLWYSRYEGPLALAEWTKNMEWIASTLETCNSYYKTPILLPVTVPLWNALREDRAKTIKPTDIEYMNKYIQGLQTKYNMIVPTSLNEMMVDYPSAYLNDGLHAQPAVVKAKANVLLNMYCNQEVTAARGYPIDKTCCYRYTMPNFLQFLILLTLVLIVPLLYIASVRLFPIDFRQLRTEGFPSSKNAVLSASLVMSIVLTYCYITDRTGLFEKINKQYVPFDFVVMTAATVIFGALTITKSDSEQGFMGRDQSDEWKGWMQIMVLIYHITGASKVLPIYKLIRVMVAAYLFMTGYGHTIYFYKKNDFSLKRVANVLVRLNLLSAALAYIMNTDYLFYYFAPLSSFFFMVVYLTMRFQSKNNKNFKFLMGKLVVSSIGLQIFLSQHGFLEVIWFFLEKLFFVTWNLREWRFRVLLDLWIVYIGMFGAIISIKVAEHKVLANPAWPSIRVLVLSSSVGAVFVYYLLSLLWNSKVDYNAHHPYISFIPILSFLFLRNATSSMRNHYSTMFAWIGKCSLETFTLQFHIWMGADTKAMLTVLPGNSTSSKWANLVVLTPMFLYLSYLTAGATGKLTALIVNGTASAPRRPAPTPALPAPVQAVKAEEISEKATVEEAPAAAEKVVTTTATTQSTEISASTPATPAAADVEKGNFEEPAKAANVVQEEPASGLIATMLQHPFTARIITNPGVLMFAKLVKSDLRVRLILLLAMMWAWNIGFAVTGSLPQR
ncbi:10 TM acyl transferase domain found in Cas1p-domain-containing protein [Limtongia smithiae]|uniref:10 TM acyl transferase domain found in Cas1p-domain-containing protein n=1 Tax=Limtongia smithiae TaxID=1125753 RepID=UPI0034CD4F09